MEEETFGLFTQHAPIIEPLSQIAKPYLDLPSTTLNAAFEKNSYLGLVFDELVPVANKFKAIFREARLDEGKIEFGGNFGKVSEGEEDGVTVENRKYKYMP